MGTERYLDWGTWLEDKSHIRSKLAKHSQSVADEFLNIHATSEAALRRLLFIGLRMNQVTYKNTNEWLRDNDRTPSKNDQKPYFIYCFNTIYPKNWQDIVQHNADFSELWDLWNDFTKTIRNHLAHGIRRYEDEWTILGIEIDQRFIMSLDNVIRPLVGGSPFMDLSKLSPRLPRGKNDISPYKMLGTKKRNPRPKISLSDAVTQFERFR